MRRRRELNANDRRWVERGITAELEQVSVTDPVYLELGDRWGHTYMYTKSAWLYYTGEIGFTCEQGLFLLVEVTEHLGKSHEW